MMEVEETERMNLYRLNKLNQLRSSFNQVNAEQSSTDDRNLEMTEHSMEETQVPPNCMLEQIDDDTIAKSIPEYIFDHYSDTDSISSTDSIDSDEAIAHILLRTNNFLPKEAIYDPTVLDSSSDEGACDEEFEDDTIQENASLCYSPISSKTGLSFAKDHKTSDSASISSPGGIQKNNQGHQTPPSHAISSSGNKELGENAPETIYLPNHLISPPRINRTRNDETIQGSTDHELLVLPLGSSTSDISMKSLSPASKRTSSTQSSSNASVSSSVQSMDSIKSSTSHDEIDPSFQDIQSNHQDDERKNYEIDNINDDIPLFLIPQCIKKDEERKIPFEAEVFNENKRSLSGYNSLSSSEPSQKNMFLLSSDVIDSFLPLIDLDLGSGLDDGDLFLSIVDYPRMKTKQPRQKIMERVSKKTRTLRSIRSSIIRRNLSNSDNSNNTNSFSEKDTSGKDRESENKQNEDTKSLCSAILNDAIGQSRRIKKLITKGSYQNSNDTASLYLPKSERTFQSQSSVSVDVTKTPCTLSLIEYLLERIEKSYYCDDFHEVSEALTDMLSMIEMNSNIDGSSEISAVMWYNEGLLYLVESKYVQAIVAFGNAADIFQGKNRMKEYLACVIKVGFAYFAEGNFTSSLGAFNKAINILSSQAWSDDSSRKVLAELMNNIACIQYMTGNTRESWKNFKESLTIQSSFSRRSIYCDVDNNQTSNSSILNYTLTLCNIGYLRLFTSPKSVSSTIKYFEDAITRQQQLEIPKNSQLYLSTLEYLSMANLCAGNTAVSIKVLNRILQIYIKHFGAEHPGCELILSLVSLISSPKNVVVLDISFVKKWKEELSQDKDANNDTRLFNRLINFFYLLKKHNVKKLTYIV